jgi:hypothetical protein
VGKIRFRHYEKIGWLLLLGIILVPVAITGFDLVLFSVQLKQKTDTVPGWSLIASVLAGTLCLSAFFLNFWEQRRLTKHPAAALAKPAPRSKGSSYASSFGSSNGSINGSVAPSMAPTVALNNVAGSLNSQASTVAVRLLLLRCSAGADCVRQDLTADVKNDKWAETV